MLLVAALAWPMAAVVRRIRHPCPERSRIDALLRLAMTAGAVSLATALVALMPGMPRGVSLVVPSWAVYLMMGFLSLTVAAVVPALAYAVRNVRGHRGWLAVGSSTWTTVGLLLVAMTALSQHLLTFWDITF